MMELKEGDVPKEIPMYVYRLEGDEETYKIKYDQMLKRERGWLVHNARLRNELHSQTRFARIMALIALACFVMAVLT